MSRRSFLRAAGRHGDVEAELASLDFQRGEYPAAARHADAAIGANSDQLLARWIRAELHRTAGRVEEADRACKWLVDYYNAHDVKDAESLRWIGLAAAQYALEPVAGPVQFSCQRALSGGIETGAGLLAGPSRGGTVVSGEVQLGRRHQGAQGGVGTEPQCRGGPRGHGTARHGAPQYRTGGKLATARDGDQPETSRSLASEGGPGLGELPTG